MSFLVLCLKIHNILNWLLFMRVTFWTFTDLLCHLFNWWGSSRMWRCQLWKVSLLLALHCTIYSIFDTGIFNGNKKGEVSPHIFVTFSLQIIFLKIHVGLVIMFFSRSYCVECIKNYLSEGQLKKVRNQKTIFS